MLHRYVEVSQHSHVLELSVLLFVYLCSELCSIFFDVGEAGLYSFYGLFVEGKVGKDDALVYVCGRYGFVGIFIVLIQKALLYFEGHFERLEGIFHLFVFLVETA